MKKNCIIDSLCTRRVRVLLFGLFFLVFPAAVCAVDAAPILSDFTTFDADQKFDTGPGTFCGWRSLFGATNNFTVKFRAIKGWDLFFGLKCGNNVVNFVVGGWGNTHAAIELIVNGTSTSNVWVQPNDTPGYTTIIPDVTNPVDYTVTVVPEANTSNGILTLVAKTKDGSTVNVFYYKAPWLNQQFTAYSFRAWNGPVKVALPGVKKCWIKSASSGKYLSVNGTSLVQSDKRPDLVNFVIHNDSADPSKQLLFSCEAGGYVTLKNLQQIDSDNLSVASKASAIISADETAIDPSAFGRLLTFEASGSNVLIRNTVGTPSTYLRIDDDGNVRAFKADPSKSNKYVAPIAQAEATVFVLEVPPQAPSLNTGDVVAFKFADGSFIAFDDSGALRLCRQSTLGVMDPHTHFKVLNFPDAWKQQGYISFATYDYDVTKDTGVNPVTGQGTLCASDAAPNQNQLRLGTKNETAVITLQYDASSGAFSFGFRGNKISKNPSNNPADPLILKTVNPATPTGDYVLQLVTPLAAYQRMFEGLAMPTTVDAVKSDLAGKFTPVFQVASKTADDWTSLFAVFKNYLQTASALPGFTAPGASSAPSVRDSVVTLLSGSLNQMPQTLQPQVQALIASLQDMPVYLADPATPPSLMTGIVTTGTKSTVAFKIADGTYLGVTGSGSLGALNTSIYDPSVHFTTIDYNQKNGRITLAPANMQPLTYMRIRQAADKTLSLALTTTCYGIDLVVNSAAQGSVSFGFAGNPASFPAASLGLSGNGSVQAMTLSVLSPFKGALDACVLNQGSIAAGKLTVDLYNLGMLLKAEAGAFTPLDWAYYTKALCNYLQGAPTRSTEWNSPLTTDLSLAKNFPEVVVNGVLPATNAEFARRILLYALGLSGLTTTGKLNLAPSALLFAPLQVGQTVTLMTSAGTYLASSVAQNRTTFTVTQASSYNSSTQLQIAEFNPAKGTVVLKTLDGQFLGQDQASNEIILTQTRTEFVVSYDMSGNQIKLGFGTKFAQFDGSSKTVKFTADAASSLSFAVQPITSPANQLLASVATVSLDVAVTQKFQPLFAAISGKTDADWNYLLSSFSSYVQSHLATQDDFVAWGLQKASLSNQSLRDVALSFLNPLSTALQTQIQAAQSPLKDSLQANLTQCSALISKLQDIPVYQDPATTLGVINSLTQGGTIALGVGDGLFLAQTGATAKVTKTVPFDPQVYVDVIFYDQAKGRAILKAGDAYLTISAAAPSTFVLKKSPRYVEVRPHETDPTKFFFVTAGTPVLFDPALLGLTAPTPQRDFAIVGPLSSAQKGFKDINAHLNNVPTSDIVAADIQNCLDPIFTQLGGFSGDWMYYFKTFDAYLRFVAQGIRLETIQLTGVRGGSMSLKDYATRLFTSVCGQYSPAPQDVQNFVQQSLQWISGGAVSPQPQAASAGTSLFAVGANIFVNVLGQDGVSEQSVGVVNGTLARVTQRTLIDSALHFTVSSYDAKSQALLLGAGSALFDAASGMFVKQPATGAQALMMQPVVVGSKTAYYLKNSAGNRLALTANGCVFNATGDLFDFATIDSGLVVLDALQSPSNAVDLERDLAKFVNIFDVVAIDSVGLAYALNSFDSYCASASALTAWGNEKSSAGSTFREYAKLLLKVIRTSPMYSGCTQELKDKIDNMLATRPAFNTVVVSVAVQAPSPQTEKKTSSDSPAYAQLDGSKGDPIADLAIFSNALDANAESATDLAVIVASLQTYLNAAMQRYEWYAQADAFGGKTIRDYYAIPMLQRLLDNTWFFTGFTDDLIKIIKDCLSKAHDNSLSYPAQFAKLDEFAREVAGSDTLTNKARLMVLLARLVADIGANGAIGQRTKLLQKIELYFSPTLIPALKGLSSSSVPATTWSVMLFEQELALVADAPTSLDALDEKIAALEKVVIPRLKQLDVSVQTGEMLSFLTMIQKITPAVLQMVPDANDARFIKFKNVVFTYIDYIVSNRVQQGPLDATTSSVKALSHTIKVQLGLEADTPPADVSSVSVVQPSTQTNQLSSASTQTDAVTQQSQSGSGSQPAGTNQSASSQTKVPVVPTAPPPPVKSKYASEFDQQRPVSSQTQPAQNQHPVVSLHTI